MSIHNSPVSHLTDDDLDEVLLGVASPAASAHLAACEPCTQRFSTFQAELRSQLAAFNQASIAWSEARSNTISRDLTKHKATPRLTVSTVWSVAAALVLAVTFGLHTTLQNAGTLEATNRSGEQAVAPEAIHPEHDQYELASDNAMLAAINSEMGTPRPAQFGLYQNAKAEVATQHHAADTQE